MFDEYLNASLNYVRNSILFDKIKTGNIVTDTFLTTLILSVFSWVINWIYDNCKIENILNNFSLDDIKGVFYNKNTIVIEGCKSSSTSVYNNSYYISSAYSNRFKAIWNHIMSNIENNKTVYKIKENHTNYQASDETNPHKSNDLYVVSQTRHFKIDHEIYAKVTFEQETNNNEKQKTSVKTDKTIINIYSFKLSLNKLKEYVDNITDKYLKSIKNIRSNKKFIYSIEKTELAEDEIPVDCWREDLFESARTFNNIFFDGKKEILDKINFFLENKNWYYEKGIPYSIGIGLHGQPGTGKTSFIKALANYANRHIVIISLKMIKTKKQLEQFFFESTYNENNEEYSIGWDKKILVFEDIDCIGDIILNREEKNKNKKNKRKDFQKNNSENLLQSICELNNMTKDDDHINITLDDILNLWDGIRETPGRILVITSNHYNKLDPALVRPGRIDITHELSNASRETISEIYYNLFKNKIDIKKLQNVNDKFYSPAEIINIYVSNKNEKDFMDRLLENKKVVG